MATDYDAPRKNDDDTTSLEEIKEGTTATPRASDDMDEAEGAAGYLAAESINEDLEVIVLPKQDDEFTCMECFIVKHHSQLAAGKKSICMECAA
jgi:hypothetical protein